MPLHFEIASGATGGAALWCCTGLCHWRRTHYFIIIILIGLPSTVNSAAPMKYSGDQQTDTWLCFGQCWIELTLRCVKWNCQYAINSMLDVSAENLHNKRRYVCLSVCLLPMACRTAGPIKTKLGMGTHVDPGSVLVKVKVKVIYLCVRYKEFMPATPGEYQWTMRVLAELAAAAQ